MPKEQKITHLKKLGFGAVKQAILCEKLISGKPRHVVLLTLNEKVRAWLNDENTPPHERRLFKASWQQETALFRTFSHPNIASLVGDDIASYHMFFPWKKNTFDGIDFLMHIAEDARRAPFDVVRQMLEGLAYMHNMGYFHRDIKPENLLISIDGDAVHVQLTDFGHVGALNASQAVKVGTAVYAGDALFDAMKQSKPKRYTLWDEIMQFVKTTAVIMSHAVPDVHLPDCVYFQSAWPEVSDDCHTTKRPAFHDILKNAWYAWRKRSLDTTICRKAFQRMLELIANTPCLMNDKKLLGRDEKLVPADMLSTAKVQVVGADAKTSTTKAKMHQNIVVHGKEEKDRVAQHRHALLPVKGRQRAASAPKNIM